MKKKLFSWSLSRTFFFWGGGGGGGGRDSAFFFEDIAVPGNDANRMSIRPLLRMTSTKALFSSKLVILTHY